MTASRQRISSYRFTRSTTAARSVAVLVAVSAVVVGCTAGEGSDPRPAALADPLRGDEGRQALSFAPSAQPGVWNPVRAGVSVSVAPEGDAMAVDYQRTAGTASGVALVLDEGCAGAATISIRGSASPAQRVNVCLTDERGVVWALPTIKLTPEMATHTVPLAEIRPDPFQNRGSVPAGAPDLSAMRMLTLLDISGYMGAPAEACAWRIEFVRGAEDQR